MDKCDGGKQDTDKRDMGVWGPELASAATTASTGRLHQNSGPRPNLPGSLIYHTISFAVSPPRAVIKLCREGNKNKKKMHDIHLISSLLACLLSCLPTRIQTFVLGPLAKQGKWLNYGLLLLLIPTGLRGLGEHQLNDWGRGVSLIFCYECKTTTRTVGRSKRAFS